MEAKTTIILLFLFYTILIVSGGRERSGNGNGKKMGGKKPTALMCKGQMANVDESMKDTWMTCQTQTQNGDKKSKLRRLMGCTWEKMGVISDGGIDEGKFNEMLEKLYSNSEISTGIMKAVREAKCFSEKLVTNLSSSRNYESLQGFMMCTMNAQKSYCK